MDQSFEHTPLRNNDLRRRTLLQNSMQVSSPLRRASRTPTLVVALDRGSDEIERQSRRSHVDIQKRMSHIPQAQSPLNESIKFIDEEEMKNHFQICTKLFSENKINTKNVWQLHIIDLLKHMSQKPSDTLQVASTSIDIGAKVYGLRVDDVHAEGLKLASSMSRQYNKEANLDENGEGGEGNIDGENTEQVAAKKKKKKKRLTAGEKNTISKNIESLSTSLPKLESIFFSTRIDADTSPIDNLFTNKLRMDHSGYKFMLLSTEKAWPADVDPALKYIENKKNTLQININMQPNLKVCIPFNDFQVDEYDPDEEERQLEADKSLLTQRENEVVYDDAGIPIPELDGSIHDNFIHDEIEIDNLADDVCEEEEFCAQIQGEIAHIVDLKPEEVSHRTEYSYKTTMQTHNGRIIDQIWAGPSHWKLKYIRPRKSRFTGESGLQGDKTTVHKQQSKKKKPSVVLFECNLDEPKIDMDKRLKGRRKAPVTDPQKITLPIQDKSSLMIIEQSRELILKRGAEPIRKLPEKSPENDQDDYEVSPYKYENPNDSQYCSQPNDDDLVDNDDGGIDPVETEEIIDAPAQQNFLGENLVDLPETVPKAYVPYALHAKKMDMRKLKAAVWHNITNSKEPLNSEAETRVGKVVPTTFAKLYNQLPALLNEKMRRELSCPLAFVALLHVCNEENLELRPQPGNNKDFDIFGPC